MNLGRLTGFEERDISGTVPEGTTSAQVTTTFTDNDTFLGNYNGSYADNESFTVGDPSLTPAALTPPVSHVGQLDQSRHGASFNRERILTLNNRRRTVGRQVTR